MTSNRFCEAERVSRLLGVLLPACGGYQRRRYRNMFISKVVDCDAEAARTPVWLSFTRDCGCLSAERNNLT
jgi:hypothetical protein